MLYLTAVTRRRLSVDDLTGFRDRIDDCDDRLIAVLSERLAVCDEVALWKAANGMAMMQPERIQEVKARCAVRAVASGLAPEFVQELYSLVIGEACRREDEMMRRPTAR
jgi:chorismate mutase-like protein